MPARYKDEKKEARQARKEDKREAKKDTQESRRERRQKRNIELRRSSLKGISKTEEGGQIVTVDVMENGKSIFKESCALTQKRNQFVTSTGDFIVCPKSDPKNLARKMLK